MAEFSPSSPMPLVATPATGGHLRIGRWKLTARELLIALALLFFVAPFAQEWEHGELVEVALTSLVLLSAVAAVGGRRRSLFAAVCLATPAMVGRWVHHFRPGMFPFPLYLVAALAFLLFVIVNLLRFVLRARVVNGEVLCASVSVYLTMGLLWALAYLLTWHANPAAFAFNVPSEHQGMDGFNAFYFSFVTLSTVGFGDITPVSKVARMLAALEAIVGLLYVAILIARLVSLYSTPVKPENTSNGS